MADLENRAALMDPPFDIERSPLLEGVPHGFFGSAGGTHQFGYGGPGDEEEICALRAAAASAILPGAPLQAPHQVHSAEVLSITEKWPDNSKERPVADAVVTNRSDIVIGIVTADCGPVLMADSEARIVGAAHAGWRGAHGGVLENTVVAMEALGADRGRICAVLGPTITQENYEVDEVFRENFSAADAHHFVTSEAREGIARWKFDLPGYILDCLRQSKLGQIANVDHDTFADPARYYSYRRATLSGQSDYGRQMSAIALS